MTIKLFIQITNWISIKMNKIQIKMKEISSLKTALKMIPVLCSRSFTVHIFFINFTKPCMWTSADTNNGPYRKSVFVKKARIRSWSRRWRWLQEIKLIRWNNARKSGKQWMDIQKNSLKNEWSLLCFVSD